MVLFPSKITPDFHISATITHIPSHSHRRDFRFILPLNCHRGIQKMPRTIEMSRHCAQTGTAEREQSTNAFWVYFVVFHSVVLNIFIVVTYLKSEINCGFMRKVLHSTMWHSALSLFRPLFHSALSLSMYSRCIRTVVVMQLENKCTLYIGIELNKCERNFVVIVVNEPK